MVFLLVSTVKIGASAAAASFANVQHIFIDKFRFFRKIASNHLILS